MVIDGKAIAAKILDELKKRVGELQKKNITPHLAVILVGDDASSAAYVRQKELKAETIGAKLSVITYPSNVTEKELLDKIRSLNEDASIHGIIIQRPLPSHIDGDKVTLATDLQKDVDGFHPQSPFIPPIARAVWLILEEIQQEILPSLSSREWLQRQQIVILGKGKTAGKPLIAYFKKQQLPLTVIDSQTPDKETLLYGADVIISAIGKPHMINNDMIKKDAILIGVGMDRGEDGRMHPDYNENDIAQKAAFYTPVPGGVGPVNVAMLLSNLIIAAETK